MQFGRFYIPVHNMSFGRVLPSQSEHNCSSTLLYLGVSILPR